MPSLCRTPSLDFHAKRLPQGVGRRARPQHVLRLGPPRDRRATELPVRGAVVLDFHPGLGGLVEKVQRQLRQMVEHLHQPSFQGAPERFLFTVLIGAIRQGRLVHDAQPQQPRGKFLRHHGRAVVGHQGAGQSAFLNGLRETMHEIFGGLGQIPLQVAAEPRVIVQDAQGQRPLPLATRRDHLREP